MVVKVTVDGDYFVLRVLKSDIEDYANKNAAGVPAGDVNAFWGPDKEYCATCANGEKHPITAKNDIEAAIVGIAKCLGPCSVGRGPC